MQTSRGSLIGHPVENLRIILTDGASHAVDSSELAFKLAAIYAFRQVSLIAMFETSLVLQQCNLTLKQSLNQLSVLCSVILQQNL